MKYKIPFIKPDFPEVEEIADDYKNILSANWFTNFGPYERKFAEKISEYIGDNYYTATSSSATVALLTCIIGILGKGDSNSKYVIMPSFTFAAGAEALIWCGYKPLFIDIENQGLHMDISEVEKTLEKRENEIAAILFCNAFGVGTTNIEAWETLAEKWNKPLIIDSAAGFGSLYSPERKVGSAGTCEVFSFHATKPFAIGEGGAIVSKNKGLIKVFQSIQNFGFDKGNTTRLGLNGKMQEINAAIGLRQLKKFEMTLKTRRAVYARYTAELDSTMFTFQKNAHLASHCFVTVIVKNAEKRNNYLAALRSAGVEARTYYTPTVHDQTFFHDTEKCGNLKNTNEINRTVLSLPVHDNMNQGDIDLIVQTLNAKVL